MPSAPRYVVFGAIKVSILGRAVPSDEARAVGQRVFLNAEGSVELVVDRVCGVPPPTPCVAGSTGHADPGTWAARPEQKLYSRLRGTEEAQRVWQVSEELTKVPFANS